ncbi:MAG: flagellar hook capping protein [Planctomycetes bacterium]|nr:flagellar hook capping protein [Planctomycetota bacterium]
MNISGISANDPLTSSSAQGSALGKDAFMDLLVTQMKNQDPLEPTKNEDMLAQLAQFQSLEEMNDLNDNIVGLAVLQQSNALLDQLTSSSALIGKDVKYVDPETESEAWGKVESVRIVDGLAQLQIGDKNIPLANVVEIGTPPATGDSTSDSATNG